MASRETTGARPGEHAGRLEYKESPSLALPRRPSVASTSSSASKIPSHKHSFFSRNKSSTSSRTEAGHTKSMNKMSSARTVEILQGSVNKTSSRTEPSLETRPYASHSMGLGIMAVSPFGSSNLTIAGKSQRKVLRRKASSNDQRAEYARTESTVSSYEPARRYDTVSSPGGFKDPFSGAVLGVALPAVSSSTLYLPGTSMGVGQPAHATSSSRMASFNPRGTPRLLSTQNLPPPTPSFVHSSGSSTRRSESPGSFSRTSTPTSMSSHSPGIPLPAKSPIRTRQVSPTRSRPPVTRRRVNILHESDASVSRKQGLAPLRESGTSSSSSSTVKGPERVEVTPMLPVACRYSPSPSSHHRRLSSKTEQYQTEQERPEHRSNARASSDRLTDVFDLPETAKASRLTTLVTSLPNRSGGPPPRPSREGTPKLDDATGPSPVIQSNLSRLITTGHKRRESAEKALLNRDGRSEASHMLGRSSSVSSTSAKPSRLPSPKLLIGGSSRPRPLAEALRTRDVPLLEVNTSGGRIKEPSPSSTVSSKPSPRFGLFTRRTKSPLEATPIEGGERTAKKGPAAGTGHEGYGKYAKRGRSGSVSTSTSRGRSTSTGGTSNSVARTPTSRKSSVTSRGEPEMDDFLLERLAPVIISGGGVISENRNDSAEIYRTTSEESSAGKAFREGLHTSHPAALTESELPRSEPASGSKESKFVRRGSKILADGSKFLSPVTRQRENSNVEPPRRPTLATRRSLHRSQLFKEAEPMKIPAPIKTGGLEHKPTVDSYDTMMTAALRTDSAQILSTDISDGREGNWLKSKKTEKRARSPRKWNFFQRANAIPKKDGGSKPLNQDDNIKEVPVTVARLPESRSIAHYALLDSNEQDESDSAGNWVSDYTPQTRQTDTSQANRRIEADMHRQEQKYSMLLPSPPGFPTEFAINRGPSSPLVFPRQPEIALPPPTESPSSFREFTETPIKAREPRLQQVGRIPRVVSKRDRLHRPAPQSFSRPFTRAPAVSVHAPALVTDKKDSNQVERSILGVQTERIPPHPWGGQDSAQPASAPVDASDKFTLPSGEDFLAFPARKGSEISGSSSSGILSFSATPVITSQSVVTPIEDEVWREYDELLDNVQYSGPIQKMIPPPMSGKSKTDQFVPAPLLIRKDSSATGSTKDSREEPHVAERVGPTTVLPTPPRMSSVLSPLQSAELIATPLSFSDFFAGYGDRNRVSTTDKRQSGSSGSRYSSRSMFSVAESRLSDDNGNRKRNTEIMAVKTETTPGTQSNLRFSALMTSRWLSFGRVLFSPAHTEIQSNRQDRVLVLDGLGNDDWSFYCALTYPNATVYNLSPFQDTSNTPPRKQEIGGYQSPSNHRQIYHNSIAHPFPFPKGFFTAAVFRFPIASTETTCFNAISECKRVLRPGGFLEMSILDIDMVNMGDRARRAVRTLKLKMQSMEPDISLKPASDNIQKMLGRRGFENLNRCMVNVPIAGHISTSRAGSFDERDMSLGDMLKDSSQQGDEGITKMVAKVGRWWYSRCYETGVLPDGEKEKSIWADKLLLKECEKRETGLKLLICYAQKPSTPKRRTVSM